MPKNNENRFNELAEKSLKRFSSLCSDHPVKTGCELETAVRIKRSLPFDARQRRRRCQCIRGKLQPCHCEW